MTPSHAAWSRLGPAGKAAVGACAVAAAVAAATLPSLAGALFTRSPEPPAAPAPPGAGAGERIKAQLAQLDGRSLFFVPAAPPPQAAPAPREEGPRTPPKPTQYRGPQLVAMINDTAWFGSNSGDTGPRDKVVSVLSVGGPEIRGVQLLSVNPPWGATVLWQGVEFEVPLFAPDTVVNKAEPRTPPEPAPESTASGSDSSEYEGPPPPNTPDDAEGTQE